MTKNTKTYLLLGAVLFIWGAVGYRIYKGISPSETALNAETAQVNFKPKEPVEKDTFSIVADYRDPFLGIILKKKKIAVKRKKQAPPIPEIPITYTGSVLGKNSSNSIFFVNIAGVQQLLKPKQTVNGVTLVSGTEKEIKIRCQGKLRTIALQ